MNDLVAGVWSIPGSSHLCRPAVILRGCASWSEVCRFVVGPDNCPVVAKVPFAADLSVCGVSASTVLPVTVLVGSVLVIRPCIAKSVLVGSSPVLFAMSWPEMIVSLPGTRSLVAPIIGIAVVTDSFKGVPVEDIGNVAGINRGPRAIVVGRVVPDITSVNEVTVVIVEKVVGYTNCNIKAQFRRLDEFRYNFCHHRFVGTARIAIDRCRGNHPGQANVYSNPAMADA